MKQAELPTLNRNYAGNTLMVSNYPSDTKYAWWLMEHFWKIQADLFEQNNIKTYLAFPEIKNLSPTITNSSLLPVELSIPWQSEEEKCKIKDFITTNKISYIYFTDQLFFNIQYAALKRMGVKCIIVHDHTPGDRQAVTGFKGFIKSLKHKLPFFTADYFLCVSELMKQRNLKNMRIPNHKCIVIQNGITPIECAKEPTPTIRESLNIEKDSVIVCTTGRAHPYKNFDFIINCANNIYKTKPEANIVFVLVGDGPSMPALQAMVKDYKLEKKVHLLGLRNDVHDILCASDIAFHAAQGEAFSLSIIEYMSASLPVLVPDIPSVSQAIDHNENGYIYPRDDINMVADYILKLTNNKNLRKKLGSSARLKADKEYSLERCSSNFISAVKSIFDS